MGLLLGNTNYLPIMKKRKTTADNIIINGALNNSVNSWAIHSKNTVSFTDDYTTIKLTGTGTGTYANTQHFSSISGSTASTKQIIYACAKVRARTTNTSYPRVYLSYYQNGDTSTAKFVNLSSIDGKTQTELNDGEWHTVSYRGVTYNDSGYYDYHRIAFGIGVATTGDEMDIKEVYLVNLTDAFGAGNEPTKDWCDSNLTNYAEKIPIQNGRLVDETYSEIYIGDELIYPIKKFSSRFIAVGDNGGAYYSFDGITWTKMTGLPTSPEYYDVAFGNGVAVAVGSGYIYYCDDGETWKKSNSTAGSAYFSSVAFGNGMFVATYGESSTSRYSSDGINWTNGGKLPSTTNNNLAFGKGVFVSTNNGGDHSYSTDLGLTWNDLDSLNNILPNVNDIEFCKDKFIAVTNAQSAAYSYDGINWTPMVINSSSSASIYSVAYGMGKYVAIGAYDYSYYSADGITWTKGGSAPGAAARGDLAFGKDRFVFTGELGDAAYSLDGINWKSSANISSTRDFPGLIYT